MVVVIGDVSDAFKPETSPITTTINAQTKNIALRREFKATDFPPQDDVFCLTEERNYFQSKYLEQISEITAMKEELTKAKREIQKLREEVMTASVARFV